LYFYPKDNTSGCTQEAVDFTAKKATIIGISPDSVKSHKSFLEKHNLSVLLLSDPEHIALTSYGVWQKKSMYGKEYMGIVRTTFLINPNGYIEQVWNKVKVAGHARDVYTKLSSI
jgi:peroxiredoxin Q/BCP